MGELTTARVRTRAWRAGLAVLAVGAALAPSAGAASKPPAQLPPGFEEQVVFSGLQAPTTLAFAADGRVFVAEKRGAIKVFDSLSDTSPTLFADLSPQVHAFWDRGLLGLALDPSFPTKPYVYVLYAHETGGPVWGDGCPNPPGATDDGCVVAARLSRLQAAGNVMTGTEKVLIEDWCHQYPSHSIGDLQFAPDGALYVSGGEGAAFSFTDWGQDGTPLNPCGDPPGGVGRALTTPSAEGGALRSQDVRTMTDPVSPDGAILRVDPATGAGLPTNPLAFSPDPNARRIVAYGFRNPFRMTMRPGTGELWLGDVGWNRFEELNRIASPADTALDNFGWPCYEGFARQPAYDGANLSLCETLYGQGPTAVEVPFLQYKQSDKVAGAGDPCPTGASSGSGLAFYTGTSYPAAYRNALFFADYSRDCIFVMQAGLGGLPDPSTAAAFAVGAAEPVDLVTGPGGDLFYANLGDGQVRRIRYASGNRAPTAVAAGSPTSGAAPLQVTLDGTGSSDPDGDPLAYAWDLDGDGAYDDSSAAKPVRTYAAGSYVVRLRVADPSGASAVSVPLTISAGNTPPRASIASPTASTTWAVGQSVAFSGSATDSESGALGGASLVWSLDLHHCSVDGGTCHVHGLQTFTGASGSFTAPDHSYPSYLVLTLTATDPGGLSDERSVRLDPRTTVLTFRSSPAGGQVTWGSEKLPTPFSRTVIVGSRESVSTPRLLLVEPTMYVFERWSDGGGRTHTITAPATATTYTATYVRAARVTIAGVPSGVVVTWDGARAVTPWDQWVKPGGTHKAAAPATQTVGGAAYAFSRWSDGGAAKHTVIVPADGLALTVTYTRAGAAPLRRSGR